MSAKSTMLFKGIAFAVSTFVLMLALGYLGGQQIASLKIEMPFTLECMIMSGIVLVAALAIPVIKSGLKGSVRYTLAFGSLSSFVMGVLIFSVV